MVAHHRLFGAEWAVSVYNVGQEIRRHRTEVAVQCRQGIREGGRGGVACWSGSWKPYNWALLVPYTALN